MALLTANGLSKAYGPDDIFSDLSFSIPHRARIGMVGANGVGKTTLLRVMIGLEDPSAGSLTRSRGLKMGYLPQEARFETSHSLWQECLTIFDDLITLQTRLHELENAMSDPSQDHDALLAEYGRLQETFELRGGYTYETRIRMTLTGLGFVPGDYHRPMEQFSGGERTRALLARLLLSDPDLLLLDEPTNHLDIAAIEWLESYLRDFPGAVLIVSHDRYFLDQVVDHVWELTPALEVYRGNYSAYLDQREERYQRLLAEYQSQQAYIEKEEEYIRRNIAGQNTRQAQGRRKRLERLLEEAQIAPPTQARSLYLNLAAAARSGDLVLRSENLSIGYADEGRPLFQVPDLLLKRGECAAIIGPNGAGKSTFLKTLLGKLPCYAGEVLMGANLHIGYFAQAHEGLNPAHTLMEEVERAAPHLLPASIRDYLAKFLFTGDDVFKVVKMLSGGERGRLALAVLALQNANLLLLDEPTNHLDLPSQEVLQKVMAEFQGTILLVSHDRYLIDKLATQVWEVDPKEETLHVFNGTYSQYRAARQAETEAQLPEKAAPEKEPAAARPKSTGQRSNNRERERARQMEKLEDEIAGLENRLAEITRLFENAGLTPDQAHQLGAEYQQVQHDMDAKLSRWSTLADEAA
ncbi:MAG: ABC-F family ATP-binding cassette domain-containing protein [Chloroflexi bacterium]|nr:ABC-F family ATP-binding cassette domain-containing protein [Chloroflexota bacterium]